MLDRIRKLPDYAQSMIVVGGLAVVVITVAALLSILA